MNLHGANARRKRLQKGVQALETALVTLDLSFQEEETLRLLIESSKAALQRLNPPSSSGESRVKVNQPTTAASAPRTKKEVAADRARVANMLEEKRQAEIAAVHRKSGFSSFLRKLSGSFEGGKK